VAAVPTLYVSLRGKVKPSFGTPLNLGSAQINTGPTRDSQSVRSSPADGSLFLVRHIQFGAPNDRF